MDFKLEQLDIKTEYEPEICPTELMFETVTLPNESNQTKSIAIWSNEETKKLIVLYKKFMTDIGPYNRFRRKKDMWIEISSQIPNKSAKQCEERLKTILRRKKKGVIEKVYLSDAKRKLSDLEDEENDLEIIRNQKNSLEEDESITSLKNIQVWSAGETKLLVGLYKIFINEVGPQKKFAHKKDMWVQIAANFENKDPGQCEQRFNTLFKRNKKCLAKSHVNKVRRKTIELRPRHFMETSPLKNTRIEQVEEDIINEDILKPQEKTESIEQVVNSTSPDAENNELLTLRETWIEIAAKKEEGKERRHRERMETMAKFLNILTLILNSKKK